MPDDASPPKVVPSQTVIRKWASEAAKAAGADPIEVVTNDYTPGGAGHYLVKRTVSRPGKPDEVTHHNAREGR